MICRDPKPMLLLTFHGRRVVCANCDYQVLLSEVASFRELIAARDAHVESKNPQRVS